VDLIERLAGVVTELSRSHARVLVGIDGPDAAGKTTLADQLADQLADRLGEVSVPPALRASIDGFHQPRELRYRRGELSAEGCYQDSFDYPALLDECLLPFRDGAERIRPARYDYRADAERSVEPIRVPDRAVLVFDGVFLLRARLRSLLTLAVYVRVSPEETLRRARIRDLDLFGSRAETDRRYLGRYLPAQALYRADAAPESVADIVIDNERPAAPAIARWDVPHRT
jgi:uridine kinase